MDVKKKLFYPEYYMKTLIKWAFLSITIGILGGLLGAAFHHALHFVTHIRQENTWLIWLLPLGGLLSVGVYKLFGISRNRGTNEIIDAILHQKPVSPMVAPAVFLSSMLTHLFGGSAGREGAAPLCAAPPLLFGLCGAPVFVAATAVRCLLPFRSWLLRLSLRAPRLRLRARCFASRSALLAFRCGRFFAPLGAVRAGGGVPAAPHGALAPLSSLGGVRAGGGVPAAPHAPRSFFAPRCSLLAPAVGVRSVARFAPLGAVRAGGGVPAAPHGALCFRGRLCAAPPLLGCLSVLRGGGRFFGAPAPSRPALCPASLHGAYSVFSVGRSASAVFSGLFPALPRGRPCFCRGSSRPVGRVPAPLVGVAVPPLRRGGASFLIRGFLCPARAAVRCRVLFLVFLPLRCGRFGRQLPPEHPSLAPFFALGGRCRAAVAARTPANRPAASSAGGAPGRPPPSPPPSPASPVGAAPYSLSPLICGRGRGSLRGPLGRRSLRSRPRPLSGRLSGWLRRLLCVLLLRARWLRAGGGIRSA